MVNRNQKKILTLAVRAAEIMMRSGAEIYRVEDTVRRICMACRIHVVECFAIPTGIFISVDADTDGSLYTMVKRIRGGGIDLLKLSEINNFSRAFTTTNMSIEEGLERLEAIDNVPLFPAPIRIFGAALVSSLYCAIFSGNALSSLCAMFIGIISYVLAVALDRYDTNYFIKGFCCCATAGILALLCTYFGFSQDYGAMVIGTMMLFVPGGAITNSMRDLLSGDMISGVARMTEALVVAVSLASGAGVIVVLLTIMGLSGSPAHGLSLPFFVEVLLGAVSTLGFCLLFHIPKRSILPCAIIGGLGWAMFLISGSLGSSKVLSCFFAALLVGFLCGFASRTFKEASTVFIIPGIMPLVPGSGMYYTMLALLSHDYSLAASTGSQTLFMAGAIALGVMITGGFFKITSAIHRRLFRN